MSESASILRYNLFYSFVEPSFWHKFTQLKLDVDRLNEAEREIWGMYTIAETSEERPQFRLDCTAFNSKFEQPKTILGAYGTILNKNTIESFKETDKMLLMQENGMKMLQAIKSGEALSNPALLLRFLLLTFSDLKKYRFYYWFAFPAFNISDSTINTLGKPRQLSSVLSSNQIQRLSQLFLSLSDWTARTAFVIYTINDCVNYVPLNEARELFANNSNENKHSVYVVVADPSNLPENPGWTPRNILLMLAYQWPELSNNHLQLICLRLSCKKAPDWTCERSLVLDIVLPRVNLDDPKTVETLQWVGWERKENGKFGPRMVDLSEEMDPSRLSETSVDLNLKLMKWRLSPNVDLQVIKESRCLLLGAGTLGCSVARTLLGWGVRTITLVDNGHVSYSNPVRQSLFCHSDCFNGGRPKAEAAAEALVSIFPGVVAKGVQLAIPMPGHIIIDNQLAVTSQNVEQLERLIGEHDVIFLLMDSRESRWLPTVIASAKGKLTICSALGFDTFLVMRHGVIEKMTMAGDTPAVSNEELGCYFCNDVTAPGNSLADRTLDQQCTVTRPGISPVAAGLAVELMVSLLQHPLKGLAPASCELGKEVVPLSIVPHSIRGFLSQFTQILPSSPRFKNCIACSDQVLQHYKNEGFDFLWKVLCSPKYLEDVAGLTELHKQTEEAEVLMWSDEEFE